MAKPIPQNKKWGERRTAYRCKTNTVKETIINVDTKGKTLLSDIEKSPLKIINLAQQGYLNGTKPSRIPAATRINIAVMIAMTIKMTGMNLL